MHSRLSVADGNVYDLNEFSITARRVSLGALFSLELSVPADTE